MLGTNSNISSVNADISVTATGGQTPGGRNRGVWLVDGGIIESTGTTSDAATVTIQGTGGGSAGQNNFGVMIGTGVSGIRSVTGDILVEGTGGNGTTEFNHGVAVSGDGFVESTGSGSDAASIVIRGTGGTGPQNNFGVGIGSPGGRVTSNAGTIQIDGNGGLDGGKLNRGIALFGGTIQSTNSSVALSANNYFRADSVSQIGSALGTTIDVDGDDEDPVIEADVFIEGVLTSAAQTIITTGSENDTLVLDLTNASDVVVINTGNGNDTVDSSGSDVPITINGGDGNDSLTGSTFDDVLNGEEGNDTLLGLGGLDRLTGGTGTDTFESVARPLIVDTTADVDDGDYSAGELSLREAVRLANESVDLDETILFDAAINGSTITLTGGELPILNPVVINGPGTELLTIDADDLSRVFNVDDGNSGMQIAVSISGLTLTRGMITGEGGAIVNKEDLTVNELTVTNSSATHGGGIHNTGTLTVTGSTISGNNAESGGAIKDDGSTLVVATSTIADNVATFQGAGIRLGASHAVITDSSILRNTGPGEGGGISSYQSNLTVENSTLFGNESRGDGGGIFVGSGGAARVTQSTIRGNRSGLSNSGGSFIFGGGIRKRSGTLTLQNTIVAGNFRGSGTTPDDVTGTVTTGTFNLIGDSASSGGLTDGADGNSIGKQGVGVLDLAGVLDPIPINHGGPTVTFALPIGSLAIDAGDNAHAPSLNDQRGPGFDRIVDGNDDNTATVDIGSFEFIPPPPDFGDAPDTVGGNSSGDYQTTSADNGPSHDIVAGLRLGARVDGDDGTLQNVRANADDVDGVLPDDEDGVLNPLELLGTVGAAQTITLLATNTTGTPATLSGWIDYNQDGVFDNATERAQIAVPDGSSDDRFTLTFPTIPSGSTGTTYARFRLSTDVAAESSTGAATDGEVEDYAFTITAPGRGLPKRTVEINSSTPNGPTLNDEDLFGSALTSLGDLDGDGVNDLAVGAYFDDESGPDRGAVHVLLLNADGSVKQTAEINSSTPNGPTISNDDRFGSALTSLGDLDGDGVNDLAVGAISDDEGESGSGAVHVLLLNSDGSVKQTVEINSSTANGPALSIFDAFGSSLTSLGDLDGDGVNDLAVGARFDDEGGTGSALFADRGAVHVLLLNADGSVKQTVEINSSTPNGPTIGEVDNFGNSVASLGDLDGDGVNDLAVGAKFDEEGGPNRGTVHLLLLNADGSVKQALEINSSTPNGPHLSDGDFFGSSLTALGDVDGDGVNDLAVGAYFEDESGNRSGVVYVLLLNVDGSVKQTVEINSSTPNGPALSDGDKFGFSLTSLGDLDGDGINDLAVGAYSDDEGGTNRGAVHVLFLEEPDVTSPTVGVSLDDSSVRTGETVTVTFTFSEAPIGFGADDVTAQNGTLSAVTATGDPLVFTAIFTPTANIEDATNVISVGTDYTDHAGNAGTAGVSANYTIDTLAPTVAVALNESAFKSGETATVTFTFSDTPVDFATNDVTAQNGTLSAFTATGNPLIFTATFTPTAGIEDATNVISVGTSYTDAAGNAGTAGASANYAIETLAPTVTVNILDAAVNAADNQSVVAFEFSEVVNGFSMADISASGGTLSNFSTIDGDSFVAIFTATDGVEVAGSVSVDMTYTDAVGNVGTSGSDNVSIDTLSPTVAITPDGTTTTDSPIVFTFQFSEVVTGFAAGDVNITNGSAGTFTAADADTFTLEVTPTAPGTVSVSLSAGVALDVAGNDNPSDSASVTSSAPGAVALPGGGNYEVLINSGDLVVRIAGGAEQFRRSVDFVSVLEIMGSAGADLITILNSGGTLATPILFVGKGGDDQFDASLATGSTTLIGGGGNDTLTGGTVDDFIIGGRGKDVVSGNAGNDQLDGRSGRDTLTGGAGSDTIRGGRGQDSIEGNQEADVLMGGGGPDTISGGDGNDRIVGGPSRDLIDGDGGDDTLFGNAGRDNLAGGLGNDTLNGVFRDDAFNNVVGPDTLIGGQRPSGRRASPIALISESAADSQRSLIHPALTNDEVNNGQRSGNDNAPGELPGIDEAFVDSLIPELLDL